MLILVSFLCGMLSGMGVGGGNVLLLWLTGPGGMEPEPAKNLLLLFFLCTGAAASLLHRRAGLIRWKVVLPAAIPGCAAALLTRQLILPKGNLLQWSFTGFLLVVGLLELFRRTDPG